jgi:hypothetical protein
VDRARVGTDSFCNEENRFTIATGTGQGLIESGDPGTNQ